MIRQKKDQCVITCIANFIGDEDILLRYDTEGTKDIIFEKNVLSKELGIPVFLYTQIKTLSGGISLDDFIDIYGNMSESLGTDSYVPYLLNVNKKHGIGHRIWVFQQSKQNEDGITDDYFHVLDTNMSNILILDSVQLLKWYRIHEVVSIYNEKTECFVKVPFDSLDHLLVPK